jgi:phage terminase large subunit
VKIVRIGNNIFIKELLYESGSLSPTQITVTLKAEGFLGETDEEGYEIQKPVYCEHDPDMTNQLRRLGVLAIPARKGPGSIRAGISKLKEYNVYYTRSSKNLKTERSKYMWIVDEKTGQTTNEPIDKYNHLMDAIRYGVFTHFYRQQ